MSALMTLKYLKQCMICICDAFGDVVNSGRESPTSEFINTHTFLLYVPSEGPGTDNLFLFSFSFFVHETVPIKTA